MNWRNSKKLLLSVCINILLTPFVYSQENTISYKCIIFIGIDSSDNASYRLSKKYYISDTSNINAVIAWLKETNAELSPNLIGCVLPVAGLYLFDEMPPIDTFKTKKDILRYKDNHKCKIISIYKHIDSQGTKHLNDKQITALYDIFEKNGTPMNIETKTIFDTLGNEPQETGPYEDPITGTGPQKMIIPDTRPTENEKNKL